MSGERELARFFDRAAERGAMARFDPRERPRIETLIDSWELRPGQRILEVGSGSGRLSELLQPRLEPDGRLLAVDISLGMLRRARPRAATQGFRLAAATAGRIPLPGGWCHMVLCFQVFPHLIDGSAALREFARVLAPGGALRIAHLMAREEVNTLHACLGEAVRDHHIPPDPEIRLLLQSAGFQVLHVGDTPEGYRAEAKKPTTPRGRFDPLP